MRTHGFDKQPAPQNPYRRVVWWLLISFTVLVTRAHADLLATYPIISVGGARDVYTYIADETYITDQFGVYEGYGTLFEDIIIKDGETRTDTVDMTSDPDFAEYTEFISDGLDWWLYEMAWFDGSDSSGVGRFNRESLRFDFTDPDHSEPDLNGYVVESVVRTITVVLDTPGTDPVGDGIWTDYWIEGVFEIHGHPVPEPASLGLLLLGAVGAFGRRRRP